MLQQVILYETSFNGHTLLVVNFVIRFSIDTVFSFAELNRFSDSLNDQSFTKERIHVLLVVNLRHL
jgi:hypothetical protein